MTRTITTICFALVAAFSAVCPAYCADNDLPTTVTKYHGMGYVVVSPYGPKDGGDFGRFTPGTKTSGIQEAIDYAKSHKKDVYIAGGAVPKAFHAGANYEMTETLRIPCMQDFRLDSGEYCLVYRKKTGDAIVFDSQMSCRYKFGIIVSESPEGSVVRIQPKSVGPDDFCVFTTTVVDINAIVGAAGAWQKPGLKGQSYGLFLDGTYGPIDANKFSPIEIVGCDKGIYLKGACTNNWIESQFLHMCNTHLQVGGDGKNSCRYNRISAYMDSHGIADSVGAWIGGQFNIFTLNVAQTSAGKNIVFDPEARDNLVTGMYLPNGITNNAKNPTNRITTIYPLGFDAVETPAVPASGEELMNRGPYTVQIMVQSPGAVSEWTLTDGNGASSGFKSVLYTGQQITLEPGDKIELAYTQAPTWKWRAMR